MIPLEGGRSRLSAAGPVFLADPSRPKRRCEQQVAEYIPEN
jgi:hypothetical protein